MVTAESATSGAAKAKELLEDERIAKTRHLSIGKEANESGELLPSRSDISSGSRRIRLGILGAERTNHKTVFAIKNPISLCTVTAVASKDRFSGERFLAEWGSANADDISVFVGEDSFDDVITSDLVDAVFLPYPEKLQKDLILRSLNAGKHVIMNFPVQMSHSDTFEIIDVARSRDLLLMDGTKFVHQQRTEDFISRISLQEEFGPINQIDTTFHATADDKSMHEHLWLSTTEHELGCLSSLGWFCSRMAVALFGATGGAGIKSAQINHLIKNDMGIPIEVKGEVHFDQGCVFNIHVSFTQPTKQSVKVFGENQSGEMYDAFFNHDIFTSFQIHKKEFSDSDMIQGFIEVTDSIECRCGPLQDAFVWRKFGALCRDICDAEEAHKLPLSTAEWPSGPASREAIELLTATKKTQLIIDALAESLKNDCSKVDSSSSR